MTTRKEIRTESKKRKAIAFLKLVKGNNDTPKEKDDSSMKNGQREQETSNDPPPRKNISEEEYQEARRLVIERKKASMQKPKIFLTLDELTRDFPGLEITDEIKQTPPLFLADLQHLMSYSLLQMLSSTTPRWCRLLRPSKVSKLCVVVLDSLSSAEFQQYGDSLPTLKCAFDIHVEMVSPLQYGGSVREDILNVPMSFTQVKKKMNLNQGKNLDPGLFDSFYLTKQLHERPLVTFKQLAEVKEEPVAKKRKTDIDLGCDIKQDFAEQDMYMSTYKLDRLNRTALLLSPQQMLYEVLPMPSVKGQNEKLNGKKGYFHDYVFSKVKYTPVTDKSPLFAVDCEMVQTESSSMDLARVSIVNERLETVYDTFVKPHARIINYVTRFSGITPQILKDVWTRLEDVQRTIQMALPSDAILCGQSIGSDLRSLKMFHPYIIDTSVIFNLTGDRRKKTGLKRLADEFLGKKIQHSNSGHSSVEDAKATMELVLLKLRNGITFGDSTIADIGKAVVGIKPAAAQSDGQDKPISSLDDASSSVTRSDEKVALKPEPVENLNDSQVCCNNSCRVTDSQCVTDNSQERDSNSVPQCSDIGIKQDPGSTEVKQEPVLVNENIVVSKLPGKLTDLETKQRRSFYQREGSLFVENFFQILDRNKKTGTLVDEPESKDFYPALMQPSLQIGNTDKERTVKTKEAIKTVDFCMTHLYGYRDFLSSCDDKDQLDEEEKKKALWKLDRRFWQILTDLPPCSLYVVVLTGQDTGKEVIPAMTFAKIVE